MTKFRSYKGKDFHNHWCLEELSTGLKEDKISKLFIPFFICVRILSVVILILLSKTEEPRDMDVSGTQLHKYYCEAVLYLLTHFSFWIYMVLVKPFQESSNNLIESINGLVYLGLITVLIPLNSSSDWSDSKEELYIYGLLIAPMMSSIISIVYLLKSLWKLKKSKKFSEGDKVIPVTQPSQIQTNYLKHSHIQSSKDGGYDPSKVRLGWIFDFWRNLGKFGILDIFEEVWKFWFLKNFGTFGCWFAKIRIYENFILRRVSKSVIEKPN